MVISIFIKVAININNISPAIVNIIIFDEISKLHGRSLLFNPFFKAPPAPMTFVTYTTVANVPNGINNFKFRLTNPNNEVIYETKLSAVEVKQNCFSNVLIWKNVHFKIMGEHNITLYLSTESGFEPAGSAVLFIEELPMKPPKA
ncbi:hypothetical protein RBH29_00930 [Herbivorax sp. ANBcel31]|uniref:hypothetical protein n=1 Tax=Herbivorax sp. ANBcel31 TaxID=3069754 RepID=UPI0027AE7B00|nr:hypothetical protein [Herbivorax sp. ANBcel31]MDQ2085001.1 hypothetical protein [Herbivorax sp. ANBcel31]